MSYIIELIDQREAAALCVDGYDAEWDSYMIGIMNQLDAEIGGLVGESIY